MSMQAVTILSGVLLLAVFACVAWRLRRRSGGRENDARGKAPTA